MTASPQSASPLVEVDSLTKHFASPKGKVRAVDGVSFSVGRGETLGLVGESGCGKSTTGRLLLRLIEPTAGTVRFDGNDILGGSANEEMEFRKRMSIIFQDPFSSLNPRMSLADTIAEPLVVHKSGDRASRNRRVSELLDMVGLASSYAGRLPHQLSGGQRQRVGIARALALEPEFVVCDEAVSALDVSVQAQILNLLAELQRELNLAYLFISHNLAVVRNVANRVAVMYLGKIVEIAPAEQLYLSPEHPYTRALLSAIPIPDPDIRNERIMLTGDLPSPVNPPSGCRFRTRCNLAEASCAAYDESLIEVGQDHQTACEILARAPAS